MRPWITRSPLRVERPVDDRAIGIPRRGSLEQVDALRLDHSRRFTLAELLVDRFSSAPMSLTTAIGAALVEQRGFTPVGETGLPECDVLTLDDYDFVGVRSYWGSMVAIGLLPVGHEDAGLVEARADEFCRFSSSLRQYAARTPTRLGAFGVLVVVAPGPTSAAFRALVASQKRGSAWRQSYCLAWLIDRAGREVHRHHGFPLVMFPGRRFLQNLVAQWDEGAAV